MTAASPVLVRAHHSVDSGVCTLTAAPGGPAGLLGLDVVPGLRLRVDRLEPRLLVDVRLGRDLRGDYPAGAVDVVRLLLGDDAAGAAAHGRSGPVPFALDASPRREALLSAVSVAARARTGLLTEVRRLAELSDLAAAGAASPALDALALRCSVVLAARLRGLRRGEDRDDRLPLEGWEAARAVVRRRLGDLDLGPIAVEPLGTTESPTPQAPTGVRSRVLVGAPVASPDAPPRVVAPLAMRLPTSLRGRDETELLTVEVVRSEDHARPFDVRVGLPRTVTVDLWLRVADEAGTPLLHVRETLHQSAEAVFRLPAECGVPWGATYVEVLTHAGQPARSFLGSTAAHARAMGLLALAREGADPAAASRLWSAAGAVYASTGSWTQAVLALDRAHPDGGPPYTAALDRLRRLATRQGASEDIERALHTRRRWLEALPASPEDIHLDAERQAVIDTWVLRQGRALAGAYDGASDLASRANDLTVLFGCADTARDEVRLERAVARLELAAEAMRSLELGVLHGLLADLVEDYDVLDERADLRAEVARLRDLLSDGL